MLWKLMQAVNNEEFVDQAWQWTESTTDHWIVGNVILELLRRKPTKEVMPAIVRELIKLGDEESIIKGKDFLKSPLSKLELLWDAPVREQKGEMLEALLIGAASDNEVLDFATDWLAIEVDPFDNFQNENIGRVKVAYENAIAH